MTRICKILLKALTFALLAFLTCTKLPSNMDKLEHNIGATMLFVPPDGSTDNVLRPKLEWLSVAGATRYDVQVSTESDFSSVAFEDTAVTDTFAFADSLKYKTMYYWRVQVHDAITFSEWTPHRIFTTIIEPMMPVAGLPNDTAKSLPTSLTLTWSTASGAASYCVQIASDTGFKTIVMADSTHADTSKLLSGLSNSSTYYWRVRSQNPGGTSAWTAIRSFTTIIAAPKTPLLDLPANGAMRQPLSLTLFWNKVSDASSYSVQVASDVAFANIFFKDSMVADTSRTVSGLVNGVLYYWRVKSMNDGGVSAWSNFSGFMTDSAMPQRPVLVAPADGAMDQRFPLKLSWNRAVGAGAYHVQMAIDSGFSSLNVSDSTLTDTSYSPGGLANDTKYYWRVRAKNPIGVSAWSLARSLTTFATTLKTPVLKSPADASTGQPVAPSLVWQRVSGIKNYHIQVSLTSDFSSIVQDSVVIDTVAQPKALTNNTTYYWHVRAENAPDLSNWSSPWRFTTILAPPAVPALVSPADGVTAQQVSLSLTWKKSADATSYRLQVSSDSNFSKNIAVDSVLSDSTLFVGGLSNSTTYYWRVNAGNAIGSNGWSGRRSFTTFTPTLATPTLTAPQNGAADVNTAPTVSWSTVAYATTYEVQVSTARDFTTVFIDDATLTTGSKQLSGLANSTTYYWKVMARNLSGAIGSWSDPWSFTTIITTPGTPALVLPADNAVNQPVSLGLTWNKTTGASSYLVQVATDTGFTTSKDTSLTDTLENVSGLLNSTKYYWRVKGKNASGYGSPSAYRTFATIIASPATPVPSSPADSALNVDLNPQISWNAVTGAASYHLQVATSQDFSTGLIVDDSTYTQTSKIIGPVTLNTSYFWRVQAKNAGGTSIWSSRRRFTTMPPPPIPPTLVSPVDAAAGQPDSLTLTWNKTAGATVYYVAVATDTGFSTIVKTDSTVSLTDTTMVVKGLASATAYHWRVQAKNGGGTSNWSGQRSFATTRQFSITIDALYGSVTKSPSLPWYDSGSVVTLTAVPSAGHHFTGWSQDLTGTTNPIDIMINTAKLVTASFATDTPAAPVQTTPTSNQTGVLVPVQLRWTSVAGVNSYRVMVSTNPLFSPYDVDTYVTSTSYTVSTALANDTRYYWRVNSTGTGVASPWVVDSFTTALDAPVLSSPANNATGISKSNLSATWSTVTYAASYDIVVSTDAGFVSLVMNSSSNVTNKSLGILASNTLYYWKVRARNADGAGAWSTPFSFTTLPLPDAPSLVSPTDNATGEDPAMTISWSPVAGVAGYRAQVSTVSDFSTLVKDSALTQQSMQLTGLFIRTQYYWRVQSVSVDTAGPWSGAWAFGTKSLSWSGVNSGLTNTNVVAVLANGGSIFAATNTSIFVSANNGTNWSVVDSSPAWSTSFATLGGNLFAGTSSSGMYRSTDNGVIWRPVNSGLTNSNVHTILVSGNNIFAGTAGGVFLSADNGASWTSVSTGLATLEVYALAISGSTLFAGTWGGGIFVSSNNGASWTAANSGLANLTVDAFGVYGGTVYAGTNGAGVFKSSDNGASWTQVSGVYSTAYVRSFLVSGNRIFVGTSDGNLFLTENNGVNWVSVSDGLVSSAVFSLVVSGSNIFAGIDVGGVFISPLP